MVLTWGFPLGPTLANFYLAHMVAKIVDSFVCPPKLYARFVDDCFAVFNNDSSSLGFLSMLNSQHNNIKYTALLCTSFLDVRVKVNNVNVDTWMWCKLKHSLLVYF